MTAVLIIAAVVAGLGIAGLTTVAVVLINKGHEAMALYPIWLIFCLCFFFLLGVPL